MNKVSICGGVPLEGAVRVSGAKNACMAMMAAALLTDEPCILRNVPQLRDVDGFIRLLQTLGVEIEALEPHTWRLQAKSITHEAPYDLVRKMRASVCILGGLIGRLHRASLPLPGGCVIGNRPIDLHLYGMQKLGCSVSLESGIVTVKAKALKGQTVFLGGRFGSTVTGTANVLMAATLTPGVTVIESAACEPEIIDLCRLLQQMGASIEGVGSPTLKITGTDRLHGFDYTVIGDRIEAGTFVLAALVTRGHVRVCGAQPQHLNALLHVLERIGADVLIDETEQVIEVFPCLERLRSFEVTTLPFPGFPTDLQAQLCVLGVCIPGLSLVTERIYPQRFMHVAELQRLGAHITLEGSTAILQGGQPLSGADVMASDLRAGAALYLAGLVAQGETRIHRIYHVERGYENLDHKLCDLGANVERTEDADAV